MERIPKIKEDILIIRMVRMELDWRSERMMLLYRRTIFPPHSTHREIGRAS